MNWERRMNRGEKDEQGREGWTGERRMDRGEKNELGEKDGSGREG